MAFVKVGNLSDIPKGTMKSFSVGIWQVLVANVDGKFYAMNNACPHKGWSLALGTLKGAILTCELDGSMFDVRTGKCVAGPKTFLFIREKKGHDNQVFEVKTERDDNIMVSSA